VSTKPLVDTCSDRSAIRRSLRQSALSGRRASPRSYGGASRVILPSTLL
jgi:hypothetical protein